MPQGFLVEHACAFLRIIAQSSNLVGNMILNESGGAQTMPYHMKALNVEGRLVTSLSALTSELIG
jgi:hypothetical protein